MFVTIDANLFLNFFLEFVFEIVSDKEHKMFVLYLTKLFVSNIIVKIIFQVYLIERSGNILIFVFGVDEMNKIIKLVQDALYEFKARFDFDEIDSFYCFSFHVKFFFEAQKNAVKSVASAFQNNFNDRKLLIVTNVAKSFVTFTNVILVIDFCKVKSKI